jgi:phosphoglycerate dehydrogenase-like enzyme
MSPLRSAPSPSGIFLLQHSRWQLLYGDTTSRAIAERVDLLAAPEQLAETVELPPALAQAEIVFAGWTTPVMDEAFLAQAPKLKIVFYAGGSVRTFATDALWARGIRVTSSYAVNAVPTSEYAFGAIVLSLKRAFQLASRMRAHRAPPDLLELTGGYRSTVGLISLGAVGRRVRELLRGFAVNLLAYDPFISAEEAKILDVQLVSLDELFRRSDVVSVHTPLKSDTAGLIGRSLLSAMKPGATLVNTARGAIIQEPELISVLQQRLDLQAILDVTWPEPPAADSPLFTLPNVFLTPHIAGSVGTECLRLGECMAEELDRYLRGEPLWWEITRERAAAMA